MNTAHPSNDSDLGELNHEQDLAVLYHMGKNRIHYVNTFFPPSNPDKSTLLGFNFKWIGRSTPDHDPGGYAYHKVSNEKINELRKLGIEVKFLDWNLN